MLEGIPLEYEPPLGIGKEGRFKFFSKITSALLGCIWGEIFFRKSYLRGVRGDEIRGIVFIGDSI